MMNIPKFKLNDGNEIPSMGFGVFQIPTDGSTYRAVTDALKLGYRHIDTATAYFNEQEVGQAIKDSGIPRDQIWLLLNCGYKTMPMQTRRKPLMRH